VREQIWITWLKIPACLPACLPANVIGGRAFFNSRVKLKICIQIRATPTQPAWRGFIFHKAVLL
jgi:hypothetical protein